LDRAAAEINPRSRITDDKIAAFVDVMRSNVLTGETPFRRAYIRSVIDQVEVDDTEIRIIGRKAVLERLVMGGGASPAGVPSFVRECRARQDSNL
jgi:site-specific DNA recombinase